MIAEQHRSDVMLWQDRASVTAPDPSPANILRKNRSDPLLALSPSLMVDKVATNHTQG
jgi:hypothetical protein